jgi:hypothetical protein
MDKVERYLDQVCRGIAGPRALRQHIRQELAEHLRDAAAVHQAAGLSAEEAMARALEDFGGPEQVRAELEATHGHRLLTVVVDKALQWKEMTMKVRWIWTTWAHVMLLLTIGMGLAFTYGCAIFLVPKYKELGKEGWFNAAGMADVEALMQWATHTLSGVLGILQNDAWIGIGLLVIWGLFEWRVRSENKTYMRLAGLGTLAVGVLTAAFLTAVAMILPQLVALSPAYRADRAYGIAREQLAVVDSTLQSLDAAPPEKDWDQAWHRVLVLRQAIRAVGESGYSAWTAPEEVERQKDENRRAQEVLHDAADACQYRAKAQFEADMVTFRQMYAAMRPPSTSGRP